MRNRLTQRRGSLRREPPVDVPLVLDLVAAAVEAGLPPGRALEAAVDALAGTGAEETALRRVAVQLSWGSSPEEAWRDLTGESERWDELAEALLLSTRTGAPAASLLASAAASARAARRWEAEAAAARLSALLVLPLGLCTLPAFLLLGVVPVVLTLAGEVLGAGS
ncbi:type II secretion system protein [Kineococcus radiotolerans SRS30216 = ATCC BAA-149]|uniref:Type II secretion system protein n=1 Tax=Kineococcus radiotolerans (strain ATCC BAA-149 / DSM 14245 / SRS30216) TaxID=266940 RepID=A6W580_KINRD|nr:type II secretion system protein [Kineococcus radiotolerans SRS30216 = ATCC BAA-149]